MPPRPRQPSHIDLPANLYESGGYYTWRHPVTSKRYGLGRDRADAVDQAREANAHIAQHQSARLVDQITAAPVRTLGDFLPRYHAALEDRQIAALTRYGRRRQADTIGAALGAIRIGQGHEDAAEITRQCAEWLRTYDAAGKRRMAKALRSTLVDLFGEMAAAGWVSVNPAAVIRIQPAKVRRARLTLHDFWLIYAAAEAFDPWVRRSMEIAVVTLQRRDDIARLGFRDVDDGRLHVEQRKTGMRIRIPVEIRLLEFGWTLAEIIARCRDHVVSPRLIHHSSHQGLARPGAAVHPQTITRGFAEARRLAGVGCDDGKTPATFHELRSLGIRLYQAQGYDAQALAGHRDAATTAVYRDARGAEWVDVAA